MSILKHLENKTVFNAPQTEDSVKQSLADIQKYDAPIILDVAEPPIEQEAEADDCVCSPGMMVVLRLAGLV